MTDFFGLGGFPSFEKLDMKPNLVTVIISFMQK